MSIRWSNFWRRLIFRLIELGLLGYVLAVLYANRNHGFIVAYWLLAIVTTLRVFFTLWGITAAFIWRYREVKEKQRGRISHPR